MLISIYLSMHAHTYIYIYIYLYIPIYIYIYIYIYIIFINILGYIKIQLIYIYIILYIDIYEYIYINIYSRFFTKTVILCYLIICRGSKSILTIKSIQTTMFYALCKSFPLKTFFSLLTVKSNISWTSVGQIIRLQYNIDFSKTPSTNKISTFFKQPF